MSAHPWPLFDLRLRTPHLELRLPTDDDLLELTRVARAGIVEDDRTVFLVPWHRLPSPAFERQFLLHWWAGRGTWSPNRWALGLAVIENGHPIGVQDVMFDDAESILLRPGEFAISLNLLARLLGGQARFDPGRGAWDLPPGDPSTPLSFR